MEGIGNFGANIQVFLYLGLGLVGVVLVMLAFSFASGHQDMAAVIKEGRMTAMEAGKLAI